MKIVFFLDFIVVIGNFVIRVYPALSYTIFILLESTEFVYSNEIFYKIHVAFVLQAIQNMKCIDDLTNLRC